MSHYRLALLSLTALISLSFHPNDRGIGLKESKEAWEEMINKALKEEIKVVLLTPSPDQRVDMFEPDNELEQHAEQIKDLADYYGTGLVDSYDAFKCRVQNGGRLSDYMSQVNHPNKKGHQLIAGELFRFFK